MMKDIVICGAGGFAREVAWLIDNINAGKKLWNIIGFVESSPERKGVVVNDLPILGGDEFFEDYKKPVSVVCAIGSGKIRKKIISGLSKFKNIDFPNLISPEIVFSEYNKMGQGCIICAGSIITVNIVLHDFVIVNLDCTIGHDAILESYVTLSPSVNVSGHVTIEECAEVGTGANIIHEKQIGENTIIGAGSVVVSDIPENSVAVGSPAKVIKNI